MIPIVFTQVPSRKWGTLRVLPIVQSTTYKYETAKNMGQLFDLEASGFFYTRLANPTLDAVEQKIAAMEGGIGAMLTSSGQAASLLSIFNICRAGGHVAAPAQFYGGTFNLFIKRWPKWGLSLLLFLQNLRKKRFTKLSKKIRAVYLQKRWQIRIFSGY